MASIIASILAVAKAIPVLDSWLQQLVVAYTKARIKSMTAENIAAIRAVMDSQDQRPAETALGSPHAGEPSGLNGTEIRDTLPGVSNGKHKIIN